MNSQEIQIIRRALHEADMWIAQVQSTPPSFAPIMGKAIDIVNAHTFTEENGWVAVKDIDPALHAIDEMTNVAMDRLRDAMGIDPESDVDDSLYTKVHMVFTELLGEVVNEFKNQK